MLKNQIFGIVFTFIYLVAMVRPLAPIIVYYANYDYISKELCVNKDKPYLDCNGRCYVEAAMKSLNLPKQNEKPVPTEPLNMQDYPYSTLDFYREGKLVYEYKEHSKNPNYHKHFLIQKYSSDIFHPPKKPC